MGFPTKIKEEALVRSGRCCCICKKFEGVFVNVHHIIPESDGGLNDLDNAIVLCLKCHGEVGHYNAKHPIGNKYSPEELKKHRDRWWKTVEKGGKEMTDAGGKVIRFPSKKTTAFRMSQESLNESPQQAASLGNGNINCSITQNITIKKGRKGGASFEQLPPGVLGSNPDKLVALPKQISAKTFISEPLNIEPIERGLEKLYGHLAAILQSEFPSDKKLKMIWSIWILGKYGILTKDYYRVNAKLTEIMLRNLREESSSQQESERMEYNFEDTEEDNHHDRIAMDALLFDEYCAKSRNDSWKLMQRLKALGIQIGCGFERVEIRAEAVCLRFSSEASNVYTAQALKTYVDALTRDYGNEAYDYFKRVDMALFAS